MNPGTGDELTRYTAALDRARAAIRDVLTAAADTSRPGLPEIDLIRLATSTLCGVVADEVATFRTRRTAN